MQGSPLEYYLDFMLSAGGGYAGVAAKARNRAGEVAARVGSFIRAVPWVLGAQFGPEGDERSRGARRGSNGGGSSWDLGMR